MSLAGPAWPGTGETANLGLVLATPPEWHEIDLALFDDVGSAENAMLEHLAGTPHANEFVTALVDQAGKARSQGICFAALCAPGEGASIDLSTVTVALRSPTEHGAHEPDGPVSADGPDPRDSVHIEFGPEQNAVVLPAGPAARSESFELVRLGSSFGQLPIFCVEYAVAYPESLDRIVVLTFTSVAPSDLDVLRKQFDEIASTLAFA